MSSSFTGFLLPRMASDVKPVPPAEPIPAHKLEVFSDMDS